MNARAMRTINVHLMNASAPTKNLLRPGLFDTFFFNIGALNVYSSSFVDSL